MPGCAVSHSATMPMRSRWRMSQRITRSSAAGSTSFWRTSGSSGIPAAPSSSMRRTDSSREPGKNRDAPGWSFCAARAEATASKSAPRWVAMISVTAIREGFYARGLRLRGRLLCYKSIISRRTAPRADLPLPGGQPWHQLGKEVPLMRSMRLLQSVVNRRARAAVLLTAVALLAGPTLAGAQTATLTLSRDVALWNDVVEASVQATGCTGPATAAGNPRNPVGLIEITLAGCANGSTATFSGTVSLGPLYPAQYAVQ